jgi:hypothetical protein
VLELLEELLELPMADAMAVAVLGLAAEHKVDYEVRLSMAQVLEVLQSGLVEAQIQVPIQQAVLQS